MESIKFTLRGIPQSKGSTKSFFHPATKRIITTSTNPKHKAWESDLKRAIQDKVLPSCPWDGPVELKVKFWIPKPKSLPKRKRSWAIKRPDLDKLVRCVTDAFTAIIYTDDSRVIKVSAEKDYGDIPGVEIEIINLEPKEGTLCEVYPRQNSIS